MERSSVLLLDKRFLKQLKHSIVEWQEMNLLSLSSSTPELQACLSLSIQTVESASVQETKSAAGELQLAATDSINEGTQDVAR